MPCLPCLQNTARYFQSGVIGVINQMRATANASDVSIYAVGVGGGVRCLPALPSLCPLTAAPWVVQVYENFIRNHPEFTTEQLEISRMMANAFFQTLLNGNLTALSALR